MVWDNVFIIALVTWVGKATSWQYIPPRASPLWGYFPPPFVYRQQPQPEPTAMDLMVDLTNALGVAILQDNSHSRQNFAFSPYGMASVLVVLYEGACGESARQIQRAMGFSADKDIVRLGFRDIHKHLKSYFSHEGFLSGITLNKETSSLNPNYKTILKFYGYDIEMPGDESKRPNDSNATSSTITAAATAYPSTEANVLNSEPSITVQPTVEPSATAVTSSETTLESTESKESESNATTTTRTTLSSTLVTDETITQFTQTLPNFVDASTQSVEPQTDSVVTTGTDANESADESGSTSSTTIEVNGESDQTAGNEMVSAEEETYTSQSTMTTPLTTTELNSETESVELELTTKPKEPTDTETGESIDNGMLIPQPFEITTIQNKPTNEKTGSLTSTKTEFPTATTESGSQSEKETTTSSFQSTTYPTAEANTIGENIQLTATEDVMKMGTTLEDGDKSGTTSEQEMHMQELYPTITKKVNKEVTKSPEEASPTTTSAASSEEATLPEHITDQTTEFQFNDETTSPLSSEATIAETSHTTEMSTTSSTPHSEESTALTDVRTTEISTNTKGYQLISSSLSKEQVLKPNGYSKLKKNKRNLSKSFESESRTLKVSSKMSLVEPKLTNLATDELRDESNNTRTVREKRAITDYYSKSSVRPDLSVQIQNGMYGTYDPPNVGPHRNLRQELFLIDGVVDTLVPVMSYTNIFPFGYIPRLHSKALEFPLDDVRYKLFILLPIERRGLRQLLHDLESCPLREIINVLRPARVKTTIPTFMVEGCVILTSALQRLGVWDVFDPRRSNLTGMSTDPELYVRNVEQSVTVVIRNYVEILDIQTRTMAARHLMVQDVFEATHPFVYFVLDTATNVALMAGQMLDPLNSRIY